MGDDTAPEAKVSFFKKSTTNKNIRKRKALDDEDQDQSKQRKPLPFIDEDTVIIQKKAASSATLSGLTTSTVVKRQDVTASNVFDTKTTFAASGTAASVADSGATRTIDIDGADDVLTGEDAESLDPSTYKGLSKYTEYVNKRVSKTTQSNASSIRAGPLRGPTNVRISSRFDYQPDICKDYKETGYCGYGDSCKFMHDRGDYKSGWQLEAEWDTKQKAEKARREMTFNDGPDVEVAIEEDDELPIACFICRKEFRDPIVTKCKHYFCENCAFKHHKTSPKCFICGSATGGLFTIVKADIRAKIAARRSKMLEREAEVKAANKDMEEEMKEEDEQDE
ncbi:hypothetical protein SmJEL517_g00541 [Synchytrium microbalum]|uniref:Pre-mRNA-splicing factor CWC24 n=1 Tax=Synchytrium microbalum TaxID=1806994 RepID=A0A507CHH9_9FUNG|nr:uncharacterized protein SmJEL517_g00541 [Synchytrium microbalum]TPX37494.1 hypothetical protein SmJEL517_g00541 [Synchytrium microbalum]